MSIISIAEVKAYRQISSVKQDSMIQMCIDDAELIDIKPLLGEILYQDVKENPTLTTRGDYPKLLAGGTYMEAGYTFEFIGLKKAIIDYAYARYTFLQNETDTAYGLRMKDYEGSSAPSAGRLAQRYAHIQKSALAKWCECKLFLDRNIDTFTYWYGSDGRLDNSEDPIVMNIITIV